MQKHESKYCPRCQAEFECKAGSISLCQCTAVVLSKEESEYISLQYNDCLCANCMKEMQATYHNQQFQNRLKAILGVYYKSSDTK
ncbi:cysteine-rich CWC family protein [Flavobacterium sp. RHBU_3]|uniref:cysteine-rich CWC family protein n=1 Tax=Flavobacterium sp. RHBU_3 TaxID=3391184 RepID=UPI003984CF5B